MKKAAWGEGGESREAWWSPVRVALSTLLAAVGLSLLVCVPAGAAAAPAYKPPACPLVTYHSVPGLHAQSVCMNLGVATRHTEPGTYLFLTPGYAGSGIYTDTGQLVWWKAGRKPKTTNPLDLAGTYNAEVVHIHGRPYLASWSGVSLVGAVNLYNQHYQQVGEVSSGSDFRPNTVDMHEFRITPQGDALIGIYDPVTIKVSGKSVNVIQYVVQKLSLVVDSHGIHTGRVLFEWRSLSAVPVSQSHLPRPAKGAYWDYFHGNAIDQDSDGNIIVSGRNVWGIYKINVHTGRVIWQVGAKGDHALAEPWCYQHDITSLGNNEYSLFDNGGAGAGCLPGSTSHAARGLIFTVDPSEHPAGVRLLHAYTHNPPIYTLYTGSVQRQSDGNVLVDWANVPEITEYTASGQVAMDLSMSGASYRGFRFAWDGQPLTKPAVAASLQSTGTTVWASWNGSTEVSAWRVLAGSSPGHLAAVGGATPKTGFETAIKLGRDYGSVAVQALNAKGRVLSTSGTTVTSGYVLTTAAGNVYNFGDAGFFGSEKGVRLPAPVVGVARTPGGRGYWLVTAKGNVYNHGDARFYGSENGVRLPAAVVGMARTPDGHGYWLVTAKGNVYNHGDARFYGSKHGAALPAPVVAIATTPDGHGYWLVTAKGNVYSFGDGTWHGSKVGGSGPGAVTGITPTSDGGGYWLVTANGYVYHFGDAGGYGSRAGTKLSAPVVGLVRSPDNRGYLLAGARGSVYPFGDAGWYGAEAHPAAAVTGIGGD